MVSSAIVAGLVIIGLSWRYAVLPSSHQANKRRAARPAAVRVSDTRGHVLASLFTDVPKDPRFGELARHSKVVTCAAAQRSSRWERTKRYLALFGLSGTTVHAQLGCADCGWDLVSWPCAEVCRGTYFGGESSPLKNGGGLYVSDELACYQPNNWQCPGIGQTLWCNCNGEHGN